MNDPRRILHIDMDAFFASVEQNDNPELRGKPVVVGSPSERGVIAAASYKAREYGVKSAMPSSIAKRLCPGLVFVKHRMARYSEVSGHVFNIFYSKTNMVEGLSVDEAFLDVTEITNGFDDAVVLAGEIKKEIRAVTGLAASAGISFNKFLAKLATDMGKPDGLFAIREEQAEKITSELPIEYFYGIGKVTAQKLHQFGVHNGSDLRNAGLDFLTRNFGKAGIYYYDIARCIDPRPVEPGRERKSIGAELTFEKDLVTNFQIIAELYKIEKELWKRVGRFGKSGRTITVKVKYDDFTQVTRSHTLEGRVNDFSTLHAEVTNIREAIRFSQKRIRLMGVTISNLGDDREYPEQLDLFASVT